MDVLYTVAGGSFLPVLDALYDCQDLDLVPTRHEQGAVNMALGWGQARQTTGVCLVTGAPGVSNASIGIHEARQSSSPLVVLASQVSTRDRGREAFQEADLTNRFGSDLKWSTEIHRADRIPELLQRGFRRARRGRPGPVLVSLPADVLREETDATPRPLQRNPAPEPPPGAVREAVTLLEESERPAIIAGLGVLRSGGRDRLLEFAEHLEIPVFSAFRRHDVFPNDHPLYLGCTTLRTAPAIVDCLRDTDLIFALGTRLSQPTTQGYRIPCEDTRLIHSDISPEVIGDVYPANLALPGDSNAVLGELLKVVNEGTDRTRESPGSREDWIEHHRTEIHQQTTPPEDRSTPSGRVHPAQVILDLQATLPGHAALVTDAGNFYDWMNWYYTFEEPSSYFGPASGGMGFGLPAALGVQRADPDRPVIGLTGDGGVMMVIQELETAVREELPVVLVIFNNELHGTIRMQQEEQYPGRAPATDLENPEFADLAETFGAAGYRVERNEQVRPALQDALEEDRPTVLDVHTERSLISVEKEIEALAETTRKRND